MRFIGCGLYMRCGQSIGTFLFVNLDNFQGCGLYIGCGLYSQKYGNLIFKNIISMFESNIKTLDSNFRYCCKIAFEF